MAEAPPRVTVNVSRAMRQLPSNHTYLEIDGVEGHQHAGSYP